MLASALARIARGSVAAPRGAAAAGASRGRALSAAAAPAPARRSGGEPSTAAPPRAPTGNVTPRAPTRSGPLPHMAPEAKVWKRRPGNRGALLLERTLREQLANLHHLASAAKVHGPPRPEPLHRLLARVSSPDDLDLALKGLAALRDAGTAFTPLTAHPVVAAAARAHKLDAAIALLRHPRTSGVAPVAGTLRTLVKAAADVDAGGSAAALADVAALIWARGAAPDAELATLLVWAWARVGRLDKALRAYGLLRAVSGSRGSGGGGGAPAAVPAAASTEGAAASVAAVEGATVPDSAAAGAGAPRGTAPVQPRGGALGAALDPRPVFNILRAAATHAGGAPLPTDVVTVLRRYVLPDARASGRAELVALADRVDAVLADAAAAVATPASGAAPEAPVPAA